MSFEEILEKLTERERYEWTRFLESDWYMHLPQRLKEFAISLPPIYLYRLREHLVEIYQYDEEKEDIRAPITVTVSIKPEWNSQYIFERKVRFVPSEELQRDELVRVARLQKLISSASSLPWMRRLLDTRNRADVLRGNQQ